MSVTVVVNVSTATGVHYAPGTDLAGYSVAIRLANSGDAPNIQTSPDLSMPFKFPDVPAGEYIAGVTRVNTNGDPVGTPMTFGPFTVPDSITPPPEDVIGDGPGAISVSFE